MQWHLWKYLTTSQRFSFWDFHRAQRYREFSFWSFQSSMRSQFVATCSFWSPSPPVPAWLSPCMCIFSWPNCLFLVPVNLPLWSLNSLLTPCTRGEPSLMRAAWLNSLEPIFWRYWDHSAHSDGLWPPHGYLEISVLYYHPDQASLWPAGECALARELLHSLIQLILVLQLFFCGPNMINHFICDL